LSKADDERKKKLMAMGFFDGYSEDENNAYNEGYQAGYAKGFADGVASVSPPTNITTTVEYNPTTDESASIVFASGSSGNHAFIDRYAMCKFASNGTNINITGTVTFNKIMNSTNSSPSTGHYRIELIADTGQAFDDFKTIYTDAYDTQVDLTNDNATGEYVCNRTPTNNTDTIDLNFTNAITPNQSYFVILTYGTTGLGYYANEVKSNIDITITGGNQ